MSKQRETSWGEVATWYDELLEQSSDSYQKNVIMPNLIRIVEPKPGVEILDVACGQGYFSRAFADNGAKVIACDISKELIEIATKHPKKGDITFYVAPADKLAATSAPQSSAAATVATQTAAQDLGRTSSMDVVTAILALQNIENLQGVFAEAARVLKPDGRLIIVINHPAFRIPQKTHWEWDEKHQRQFRRIDAYMSDQQVKIDMTPGEKISTKKKFTTSFHRPLQSYVKALNKAGFAITRLEEWISHKKSQSGPRAEEEDRMRKEIPLFACIEVKKV